MLALIIDDSRVARLILSRTLQELGFETADADGGREALALIGSGIAPDLILVDWNMPEMDGLEFVQAVRAAPYSSQAKIMMVTTETEIPRVKMALDAGADEYVMKPCTKDAIREKLELLGIES